jgi:hypothetical protein
MKNRIKFSILIIFLALSGCHKNIEGSDPTTVVTDTVTAIDTVTDTNQNDIETVPNDGIEDITSTEPIEILSPDETQPYLVVTNDQEDEWLQQLIETGKVIFDLSGVQTTIYMLTTVIEGEEFIVEINVEFEGVEGSFYRSVYRANIENLRTVDSDGDGQRELLLFFNTHGSGGQGTHDLILLTPGISEISVKTISRDIDYYDAFMEVFYREATYTDDRKIEIRDTDGTLRFMLDYEEDVFDLYDDRQLYKRTVGGTDDVYRFEILQRDNEEKILVYQYMWGYSHSSGIADIVSILDTKSDTFLIEKQWLIPDEGFQVRGSY